MTWTDTCGGQEHTTGYFKNNANFGKLNDDFAGNSEENKGGINDNSE